MIGINFWPLWKLKRSYKQLFQDFYPGKRLLSCPPKTARSKFLKYCYWDTKHKKVASNLKDLWLSSLASEKSHGDPATQVYPISKTMYFLGPHAVFSGAKLNKLQRKFQSATFLVRYLQNINSKFLIWPIRIAALKRPFPEMKILEENTWPWLNFGKGQKLVQAWQCQ